MKIAICEDMREEREFLLQKLSELKEKLLFEAEIYLYSSGEELIAAVKGGSVYSLILMDIYLGQTDGIRTAQILQNDLPESEFIFISGSRDFAPEAFMLDAVHYLVKPFEQEQLEMAIKRFFLRSGREGKLLQIHTERSRYTYRLLTVRRLESYNKGVDIYLQDLEKPEHIPLSFVRLEKQLDEKNFLKLSRGLMVPIHAVLCIDGELCRMKDGNEYTISRRSRAEVRKKYNDYLFSQKGGLHDC